MGIGKQLTRLMGEPGDEDAVSVAELAEAIGVDPRTVRKWRNTNQEPSISMGVRIADYLGVDPVWLVTDPFDVAPDVSVASPKEGAQRKATSEKRPRSPRQDGRTKPS